MGDRMTSFCYRVREYLKLPVHSFRFLNKENYVSHTCLSQPTFSKPQNHNTRCTIGIPLLCFIWQLHRGPRREGL